MFDYKVKAFPHHLRPRETRVVSFFYPGLGLAAPSEDEKDIGLDVKKPSCR